MHVIGYSRVSTTEQADEGFSLAAQRQAVTTAAAERGWTVEWASDPGCSGKIINPSLRAALEALAAGRADALVVTRMDRLARSAVRALETIKLAQEQGWRLVILDQGVDYSTPEGRALGQMLAVFAEFERELISARVREGLAQRKREGKPIGRRRVATTAVVRRICELRDAQGLSFGAIGRTLTAEGVLTPEGNRTWQESTARRIYRAASTFGDVPSAESCKSVALSVGEDSNGICG